MMARTARCSHGRRHSIGRFVASEPCKAVRVRRRTCGRLACTESASVDARHRIGRRAGLRTVGAHSGPCDAGSVDERQGDAAILAWLRRTAVRIGLLEPGSGLTDLQGLKAMLGRATVVGLAAATHGTREFFRLKHRLVEFLVREMGFTAFALESSHAAGERIDAYLMDGNGRAAVLTDQGYVAWDTKEFSHPPGPAPRV